MIELFNCLGFHHFYIRKKVIFGKLGWKKDYHISISFIYMDHDQTYAFECCVVGVGFMILVNKGEVT